MRIYKLYNFVTIWNHHLTLTLSGIQLPDNNASSLGGPEASIWKHSQPEEGPQKWDRDDFTKSKSKSEAIFIGIFSLVSILFFFWLHLSNGLICKDTHILWPSRGIAPLCKIWKWWIGQICRTALVFIWIRDHPSHKIALRRSSL